MNRTATRRVLSIGLIMGLGATGFAGCNSVSHTEKPESTTVVSRNQENHNDTVVRAYSLRGLGLKDAPAEDIQAFMDTLRKMVVSKSWDKTRSTVQVFGVLMTVRTTAENHLMIERYFNEVRQVLQRQPLSMAPTIE